MHDLRVPIRLGEGRAPDPTAAILDSCTTQSTPESGARAGWDGTKRRKRTNLHMAVETLDQLLAVHITPANAQDRAQVGNRSKGCPPRWRGCTSSPSPA